MPRRIQPQYANPIFTSLWEETLTTLEKQGPHSRTFPDSKTTTKIHHLLNNNRARLHRARGNHRYDTIQILRPSPTTLYFQWYSTRALQALNPDIQAALAFGQGSSSPEETQVPSTPAEETPTELFPGFDGHTYLTEHARQTAKKLTNQIQQVPSAPQASSSPEEKPAQVSSAPDEEKPAYTPPPGSFYKPDNH